MAAATMPETPAFGFTPEQLERRRNSLGASEIPVVTGHVTFKSPLELWAEKRGLVKPFAGNEFTEWGNRLEPVIRQKYAEVVGLPVSEAETIICSRESWRSCTPDGLVGTVGAYERGLEIKCRGVHRGDEWGVPGTDQVPHDVAVQAHWSMDITGLRQWDIATLIGGNRFGLYHLFYDPDIARSLIEIGRRFWQHVVDGTEPAVDGSEATTDFLARRFPRNDEVLRTASPEEVEWIREILDVRVQIKTLETRESELGNSLRKAIGENAGVQSAIGRATWKAPNGSIVAWKDIVEEVRPPNLDVLVRKHSTPMARRFQPFPPSKSKAK